MSERATGCLSGWVGIWPFGKANPPHNPPFKLAIQTSLGTWNQCNPQLWVVGVWGFFLIELFVCFYLVFDYFRWFSEKDPKNAGR